MTTKTKKQTFTHQGVTVEIGYTFMIDKQGNEYQDEQMSKETMRKIGLALKEKGVQSDYVESLIN